MDERQEARILELLQVCKEKRVSFTVVTQSRLHMKQDEQAARQRVLRQLHALGWPNHLIEDHTGMDRRYLRRIFNNGGKQ